MSDVILTSTSSSAAEMRHALSADWKNPPAPEPAGTKPPDAEPVTDYIARKNEEDHEKRHPHDEAENGNKPRRRSGWEKRIDKLTSRNYETSRELEAARARIAELEAGASSNGLAAHSPAASADALADQESQPDASASESQDATRSAEPSAHPPMTPAQKAEYGRNYSRAASRYPDFDATINAADAAGAIISGSLRAEIERAGNSADIVYYLAKNKEIREEMMRDPEHAAQRIAHLSQMLKSQTGAPQAQSNGNGHAATAPRFDANVKSHPRYAEHTAKSRALLESLPNAALIKAAVKSLDIDPHVEIAILDLGDDSHQVFLNLIAKQPGIFAELNAMSPTAAATRLGRIAAQSEAQGHSAPRPPKERVQPPAPISPVGASSAATSVPLDKLPPRDYNRIRNEQERRRKRGR